MVDMGAAATKGMAQGFAGLPGDLEGLTRTVINLLGGSVDENTKLPTTEEIKTWLDQFPITRVGGGANPYEKLGEFAAPGGYVKGAKEVARGAGKVIKAAENMPAGLSVKDVSPSIWDVGSQQYSSAKTSINVSKLPATFGKLEALDAVKAGDVVADIGGGRFDNAMEWASKRGATLHVIDPYNRSVEHNKRAIEAVRDGKADVATVNNVLNVIKEEEGRDRVIAQAHNALRPGGKAYFLIYEGNKSGAGAASQQGQSWQNNRKTADYLDEVRKVFDDVKIKAGMIEATKGAK
jgi:SAM-dependent methyltransferase